MKKQTKVLLAATMLTLGASFTSMAATYDWQIEDGQWVCYNEEGDLYEDEWVKSAGKDYYVDDEGVLVTSQWVDEYYVDSTGAKTINAWKYLLPADADEDDEDVTEEWFYFGSKGTTKKGKQVIDGATYYFDTDGIMLTGWINYDGETATAADDSSSSMIYAHESGARAKSEWIEVYAPEVDEDDEDASMNWYYIGSKGKPSTGRVLDINGETYFFAKDGKMLSGWVATTDADTFFNLADNDDDIAIKTVAGVKAFPNGDVYFCGSSDQGWAKKSTWIKEYASDVYADPDSDEDSEYWFWLNAKGKVFVGSATDANAAKVTFANGEAADPYTYKTKDTYIASIKEINNKDYAFNQDGEMLSGLVLIDDNMYYFGGSEDGSMKTGEVVLEDSAEEEAYSFYFGKKTDSDDGYIKGVAVTGAAGGNLYKNGLIMTHNSDNDYDVVTVNGLQYVIDADGDIKTSQKKYKDEDGNVYLDTTATDFVTKSGVTKGSIKVTE